MYSFAMILYHLFEHTPPFAGVDPVEAAKMAGLENKRPKLEKLAESKSPMPVSTSAWNAHTNMQHACAPSRPCICINAL